MPEVAAWHLCHDAEASSGLACASPSPMAACGFSPLTAVKCCCLTGSTSGLYQLERVDSGSHPAGQFAVNLFAPAESAITPAAIPNWANGRSTSLPATSANTGVAVAADRGSAGAAVVEWWVYHRGARLPKDNISMIEQTNNGDC
ncbi:MAG: hypothetical protein H6668_22130 [Ardenticatenaceae bacterium]|nr:hypothetical protein [Ardenticatenaceae bacterium]